MNLNNRFILDFGSQTTKSGIGGEAVPRNVRHTAFSPETLSNSARTFSLFPGPETSELVQLPINNGTFQNWYLLEELFRDVLTRELMLSESEIKESAFFMTETPLNPMANREKQLQIFMEEFQISRYFVKPSPALSLYSIGQINGTVLQLGEGISEIVPVYEGYHLPHAIMKIASGSTLTELLSATLNDHLHTSFELRVWTHREIVRDIKESLLFASFNESDLVGESWYTMPDGQSISIPNKDLVSCSDHLFSSNSHPYIQTDSSFQDVFFDSIQKLDLDIRKQSIETTLLCGGPAFYLPTRLHTEISKKFSNVDPSWLPHFSLQNWEITQHTQPQFSAWMGASILASLLNDEFWINQEEYDEQGPSMVHRKCY